MGSKKQYTLTFHRANGDVIPVALDLENNRYTLKTIDYFTTRYSSEDELRNDLNKLYHEEFGEEPFQKENNKGYFIIEYKFDRGLQRLNLVFNNINRLKEILDQEKKENNLEQTRLCKGENSAARHASLLDAIRRDSEFINFYKKTKKDNNSYLVTLIETLDNLITMCDQSGETINVESQIKKTLSEYKTIRGVEYCYKNYQLIKQGKEPLTDNRNIPYWEQGIKKQKENQTTYQNDEDYKQLILFENIPQEETQTKRR